MSELFNHKMISIAKPGVFIDIGSNIGDMSVPMASVAEKVYGFEPYLPNVEESLPKVAKFGNVEIINAALSDWDGVDKLYLCNQINANARHSVSSAMVNFGDFGHSKDRYIDVTSMRLDTFVKSRGIKNITAIKIDVEGAEDKVLQGAINTLMNNDPIISLETHVPWDIGPAASVFVDAFTTCEKILRECGYVFWNEDLECNHYFTPHNSFLCIKKNSNIKPF